MLGVSSLGRASTVRVFVHTTIVYKLVATHLVAQVANTPPQGPCPCPYKSSAAKRILSSAVCKRPLPALPRSEPKEKRAVLLILSH